MVATVNEYFEKSKQLFENGDVASTLESYEKALAFIDKSKDKAEYINFLKKLLAHCRENGLHEEEAVALRALGRTYSIFKNYVESLKCHRESLKIQRKLGKKMDVAEGLEFLAESLQISGDYKESVKMYINAAQIYRELGKLRKEKELKKEIGRIEDFSKRMVEDEYYLNKFNIDKY